MKIGLRILHEWCLLPTLGHSAGTVKPMLRNCLIITAAAAALSFAPLPAQAGLLGTISKGVLIYKGAKALKRASEAARRNDDLIEIARNARRFPR